MNDYTKQLEERVEQIQQRLVVSESKVAELESINPYSALRKLMIDDPEYAWSFHCNIAMPIRDNSKHSYNESNILAAVIMNHLFKIDTSKNEHYKVANE